MSADHEAAREIPLAGGVVTSVVRVGDTVRRATGPRSPAVHALLRHLESVGFTGAPRFLGIDESGREILSFVDGDMPAGAHPDLVTDAALHDIGQMLRALHTATSSFRLPDGLGWHHRSLGGPEPHAICHHDLSPRNTVFRDGKPVAFIDWDLAGPAAPIHDIVHAAWQFVPLAHPESSRFQGWPEPPNHARRLRILLDAYGLPNGARAEFAAQTASRIELTASDIDALAATGQPAFTRLAENGIVWQIRADRNWVLRQAGARDDGL